MSTSLPPALQRVLALIPQGDERRRFQELFTTAAKAIDALVELDLSTWEEEPGTGADLAAWEAVAPVVRDTILVVNEVLVLIKGRFPEAAASAAVDEDAAFDELFAETDAPRKAPARQTSDPSRPVRDAVAVIRAIADSLSVEITAFGEGIRRPRVMGHRFPLLAHLGEFRGKFRSGVGEMLYLAATAFAEVRKEDVVPGYGADVEGAIAVRRTVTMLAAAVRRENERIGALRGTDMRAAVAQVSTNLETFSRTRAHQLLRIQDKASFLEARRGIEALLSSGAGEPSLRQAVEGLDKFLDSLSVINRREILIVSDREAVAAAARHVERADAALVGPNLERVRLELQSAHRVARRLFGRDPELDAFLRAARHFDAGPLTLPELYKASDALRRMLVAVPLP